MLFVHSTHIIITLPNRTAAGHIQDKNNTHTYITFVIVLISLFAAKVDNLCCSINLKIENSDPVLNTWARDLDLWIGSLSNWAGSRTNSAVFLGSRGAALKSESSCFDASDTMLLLPRSLLICWNDWSTISSAGKRFFGSLVGASQDAALSDLLCLSPGAEPPSSDPEPGATLYLVSTCAVPQQHVYCAWAGHKIQTKLCRLCVLCVSRTEMWTRICVLCVCRTRKYLQSILRFPSTKSLYSWSEGCGSDSWSSSIASWDDGLSSLEIRLLLGTWDDDAPASKQLCQLKTFQDQHKHQDTHRIQTGHAQHPLASSTQTAEQTL